MKLLRANEVELPRVCAVVGRWDRDVLSVQARGAVVNALGHA